MRNGVVILRVILCFILVGSIMAGCGGGGGGSLGDPPASASSSTTNPLDPERLAQFIKPLFIIPTIGPDTTTAPGKDYYRVEAIQTTGFDFGLRDIMDGSEIKSPTTGQPIRTTVWGYKINGVAAGYLGATIQAKSTLEAGGKEVQVKYINSLPGSKHLLTVDPTLDGANNGEPQIRIVTHLHGGHVEAASDGHPQYWFTNNPGAAANGLGGPAGNSVVYNYDNSQIAAPLWIHDHAMGITRLNVYAGLASLYLIRDSVEDAVHLPGWSGDTTPAAGNAPYEIQLVIQDKDFYADGSLAYPTLPNLSAYDFHTIIDQNGNVAQTVKPEMFGNVNIVNGVAWPYLEVEPRRYRFQMWNGSDSRMYNMWLADAATGAPVGQMLQVGAEGGLANNAVVVGTGPGTSGLLLGNGERMDIVIDFSAPGLAGKTLILRNDCPAPFGGFFGPDFEDPATLNPLTTGRIMQFKVTKPLSPGGDKSATTAALLASVRPYTAPVKTGGDKYMDLQERTEAAFAFYNPLTGTAAQRVQLLVNGLRFDDPITDQEKPVLNTTEDWIIVNSTPDVHPMHLHLVGFQVVEKGYIDTVTFPNAYLRADGAGRMAQVNPAALVPSAEPGGAANSAPAGSLYRVAPNETTVWKDTVKVPPAGTPGPGTVVNPGYTRVRAKFDRLGIYMWHCHILSHEENAMMRRFQVVP